MNLAIMRSMDTRILPSRRILIIAISAILVALGLTYGSSLRNDFVNLDDDVLLEQNPVVRGLSVKNIGLAFTTFDPELYVPFTMLTYQAEYSLAGGLSPTLIHANNLLLHAISSILVTFILYLLFGDIVVALCCGLLFALHPLNVEAVAWASARKDVLSSAFLLGSLASYLISIITSSRKWMLSSILMFAAALLSKASVLMFPFILLLIDWLWNGSVHTRDWKSKVPFFALSFIFGCIALFGKTQPFAQTTFFQKIVIAPISTAFYLLKFLLPTQLSVLYPLSEIPSVTSAAFLLSVVLIAGFFFLAFKTRKYSKAPLVGLGIFLLMLLPSFLNVQRAGELQFASDRYAYVPMLGLLIVLGYVLTQALHRRFRVTMVIAACAVLAAGWMSVAQASVWKNSETLYRHVLKYYPESFAAHNNLGMWNLNLGRFDEAHEEFDAALALHPSTMVTINKASALESRGKPQEALELLETIFAASDVTSNAYLTAGNAYRQLGRETEAISEYKKAIQTDPTAILAYNNLGALFLSMEEWGLAADILTEAVARKALAPDVYFNLGIAEEQLGNEDRAVAAYAKATSLQPNDTEALANLATLLMKMQKFDEAVVILNHLLRIDPQNVRGRTLEKLLK